MRAKKTLGKVVYENLGVKARMINENSYTSETPKGRIGVYAGRQRLDKNEKGGFKTKKQAIEFCHWCRS